MKKLNLLLGLLGSVSIMAGATSCSGFGGMTNEQKNKVEAFTGITFLNSVVNQNTRMNLLNGGIFDISDDEAQKILPTIDALLTNGVSIDSDVKKQQTIIDNKTYDFVETISFKEGNKTDSYTLVYNKTSKTVEETDDDEKEITDYERQNGYVVFGDLNKLDEAAKYSFVAVSENEIEGNEKKFERTFKVNIDQSSYILVEEENEQEVGESETEFSYKFINKGRVDIEYSISIENSRTDFTEIEYEINGKEYEAISYSKDGKNFIRLEVEGKYDVDKVAIYQKVVDEEGNVSFIKQ